MIVGMLLKDNSPGVVGAAASAFASICPNNFSLIGRNYKRLCEILPDVEEWGQIVLIGILLRYAIAKHGLVRESLMLSSNDLENQSVEEDDPEPHLMVRKPLGGAGFDICSEIADIVARSYLEGPDKYLAQLGHVNQDSIGLDDSCITSAKSNDDVKILLQCTSPLLWSYNSAVVLAAAGFHWIMAPKEDIGKIVKPLLFLLRSSSSSKYVVLCNIQVFAKAMPSIFSPYYEDFFISSSDSYRTKTLKLDILSTIATKTSICSIFLEFQVIVHLVRSLDSMSAPAARAMVIWMLGEYCNIGNLMSKMIPTIFKYLAQRFRSESVETKLQIVNACVKVLLRAKVEDMSELRLAISYVLELAKCDFNYDVRDRARVLKNFLSHCKGFNYLEVENQTEFNDLTYVFADYIYGGTKKVPSESFSYRFYLPGSLSQIVLHAAPGYEPLPEPCSFADDETGHSPTDVHYDHESNEIDDSDAVSGSLDEENTSDYSSGSVSGGGGARYNSASDSGEDEEAGTLIHLSDDAPDSSDRVGVSVENASSGLMDAGELMSKRALESWLNENSGSGQNSSNPGHVQRSSARISIKDIGQLVKPKSYTLLDPSNGNGLSVIYRYSSEVSKVSSPELACIQVSFRNNSEEPMSNIFLSEEKSNPSPDSSEKSSSPSESVSVSHGEVATLFPMEEIDVLNPGQTTDRVLQVRFAHHLLPLKLVLSCDGRKQQVKLRPDIGYFIKPLPMDSESFLKKQSQLPGMFENIRRCTFSEHINQRNDKDEPPQKDIFLMICETLALKMLSNANLYLVSVDMPVAAKLDDLSGICLRLSGEILHNSIPCLVTLTLKGTCAEPLEVSVKMNCEETVFGLNLLNRIVNFLAEPTQ